MQTTSDRTIVRVTEGDKTVSIRVNTDREVIVSSNVIQGPKGDSSVIISSHSGVSQADRANKLVIDTEHKRLMNHDEFGDEIETHTFDFGAIEQHVDTHLVQFESIYMNVGIASFNTSVPISEDCDIAISYATGKALMHIVVIGGTPHIVRGVQVGEELQIVYSFNDSENGNHSIKIVNTGNAVDIQMKTLKTKLFGGL